MMIMQHLRAEIGAMVLYLFSRTQQSGLCHTIVSFITFHRNQGKGMEHVRPYG